LLAALTLFCSCSFFQPPPPLPRRAAIEPGGSEEEFAHLVQDADIIYFPSEAAALNARSNVAWKLLAALRENGSSFAIGWDSPVNESDRCDYFGAARKAGAEILVFNEGNGEQNEPAARPDQFVADRIANYFREHHRSKILAFVRREYLGLDHGVPYFVAQKTKARQLILNPRRSGPPAARLVAAN
jgi:hypothetical protein